MSISLKRLNFSFIFKVFLILMLLLSSVFISQQKASAFIYAGVAPAALTIPTGVYVTGAVGLAAIAGGLGYVEYQDQINEHAEKVWNGATDLAKKSITESIAVAQAAGSNTLQLGKDFLDWFDSVALPSMVDYVGTLVNFDKATMDGTIGDWKLEYFLSGGYSSRATLNLSDNAPGSVGPILIDGVAVKSISLGRYGLSYTQYNGSVIYAYLATDIDKNGAVLDMSPYATTMSKAKTYKDFWDIVGAVIPAKYIPKISIDGETFDFNGSLDNARAALPTLDAGVMVYPRTYSNDGTEVKLGADGTAVLPDGTVYSGELVHSYDKPFVDAKGNVKVGTATGTAANVFAKADSTTGEGTAGSAKEKTESVKDKSREWGKLITTKFPFSLPWDFYFLISILATDPITPNFKVDENLSVANGFSMPFEFEADFSFLDKYIGWFRTFIVIGYLFMLVMITRKLLGGAQ